MGRAAGLAAQHSYFGFVTDQSYVFFWRTLAVFVVVLLTSSLCTLILSFRLAGPIYRLRKHLKQIAVQGAYDLQPLQFRNGDFYSDLPATVNQAVERLKNGT